MLGEINIKTMKKNNSAHSIILTTILLVICLCSIFSVYNMWNNTLFKNDNWNSSKTELRKGVMGAYAYMVTHYALAGGKLNLSAWHGYQELFYKKSVDIKNLKLDFKLTPNSYFNILLANKQDTLSGIRISNHPKYPNIFFQAYKGEFIEKTIIPHFMLKIKWNQLELKFANDETIIYINDKVYENVLNRSLSANTIGFRGSACAIYIDNISFYDNTTHSVIKENFINTNSILSQIFISLLIIIFFIILLINFRQKSKLLSLGFLSITFICVLIWIFYVVKFQYTYPKSWMINWHGFVANIENERMVNDNIQDIISSKNTECCNKILFIGTSQTWGAGASIDKYTFVNKFENLLNANSTSDTFTCINTGISGLTSSHLFKFYEKLWVNLEPAVVIINLSNNDSGEILQENIKKFIELNEKKNIKTYLILEPNDKDRHGLLINHEVMRKIAQENNIMIIDMHNELLKHYDDGFLFWDSVHLTDFGQELYSEILFKALNAEIQQITSPNNK